MHARGWVTCAPTALRGTATPRDSAAGGTS